MSKSFPSTIQHLRTGESNESSRKRAQLGGKKLKGGAAIKVVCYPRPITKAMLVHASRMANRSLSSFMIVSALEEAARIKGVHVDQLVPPEKLEQYLRIKR